MGDTYQYDHYGHHQGATAKATPSRAGMRSSGAAGEIVEVQGGHIVRSTGRKDRHSKVCTAKGPRDRRVRLSAHTAIQFYDVQDRLGYDRPSKAVDWLIKKAKAAIDELAELPAWKPSATAATATKTRNATGNPQPQQEEEETQKNQEPQEQQRSRSNSGRDFNSPVDSFTFQNQLNPTAAHQQNPGSGFLPVSLDSDAIADTIKSFFPMGSSGGGGDTETAPSLNSFQSYPVPDLLSRTSSSGQTQDLRLSLQSLQEPILEPPQQQHHHHHHHHMFSGPNTAQFLGFDGPSSSSSGGWSEHHQQFQRMVASWSATGGDNSSAGGGSGSGGFIFNSIPQVAPPQVQAQAAPLVQPMLFGQNQLLISQRGPLQSSNTPSARAWIDPAADQIPQIQPGMGFSTGGFSGFRVPARIQGDEEEHDGVVHNKPSSTSSDSRH